MKSKAQIIKSLITAGIVIVGASGIYYVSSNSDGNTNGVFVKENQETKVKKELKSFEKSMTKFLQKDEYDSLKSLLEKSSKDLQELPEFIALKEDLEVIIKASDILKNKKTEDYQSIIEELKLHTDSNLLVKREAEDLTKKVNTLKAEADKKAAEAKAAADKKAQEERAAAEAAAAQKAAEEQAAAAAAAHVNPVDMTDIAPLPPELQGYKPIAGTIYPENQRGDLVGLLHGKAAGHQDDPHTLMQRLRENTDIDGERLNVMDQWTYNYLNDLSIRAYAYYVGSDFLDNEWRAYYLRYAGTIKTYFFGIVE
ncbi:hypothetical protein ACVR1I_05265 [Streptococcus cameli]